MWPWLSVQLRNGLQFVTLQQMFVYTGFLQPSGHFSWQTTVPTKNPSFRFRKQLTRLSRYIQQTSYSRKIAAKPKFQPFYCTTFLEKTVSKLQLLRFNFDSVGFFYAASPLLPEQSQPSTNAL